jgi:hypothetical protein
VAEWQTRQSQKLLRGNPRVGSSPTFGTSLKLAADDTNGIICDDLNSRIAVPGDERNSNMMTLTCPKCNAESKMSFVGNSYAGPRRCWNCHELFMINIENNVLISCEPLSQEDFEKQQEIKALKDKFKNR